MVIAAKNPPSVYPDGVLCLLYRVGTLEICKSIPRFGMLCTDKISAVQIEFNSSYKFWSLQSQGYAQLDARFPS